MRLNDRLDSIFEAYLDDRYKLEIERAIQALEQYKEADYESMPGGVDAGEFYVNKVVDAVRGLRQYGRTEEDLRQIERERQERERRNQERQQGLDKNKQNCMRVEKRFPRFSRCLTDRFQYVQPDGTLEEISYLYVNNSLLAGMVKFFRLPAYQELANKVQKIRDFGFNISSKLLNTDGGKFRTRYSFITAVTLSYQGPYLEIKLNYDEPDDRGWPKHVPSIKQVDTDGSAAVRLAQRPGSYSQGWTDLILHNVSLDHIGEIIDTVDVVVHASRGIAEIEDIQLMGTEVVEYQLKLADRTSGYNNKLENREFNLPSDKVTGVRATMQQIYKRAQEIRGYSQQPEQPEAQPEAVEENAPVKTPTRPGTDPKAPPRPSKTPRRDPWKPKFPKKQPKPKANAPVKTPTKPGTDPNAPPKRSRPPKRDPWKPKFPKKQPKPKAKKAVRETFERSVHPSTNSFWSNVRQNQEHPFSKHPLLAMYGREKAQKGWEKGVSSLKRVFPQLQDVPNPQAMQQVPMLAMQALQKVMQAEAPYREQLKQIATDVVVDVWGVPPEMLNPQFTNRPGMPPTDDDGGGGDDDDFDLGLDGFDEGPDHTDPNEADRLRDQINKRITMNALTQGSAVQNMATIHHLVNERLQELAPELLELYDKFSSSATSMYWIVDFSAMANLADQAIGHVQVEQIPEEPVENPGEGYEGLDMVDEFGPAEDDNGGGIRINANAMVFPVLVQELVKGVMEVLTMPGFEDLDEFDTSVVMHHADRLEDEPWLIQIGPHLWETFLKIVPRSHPLAQIIPHLAAKDPKYIHDLLSATIEAVHATREPEEQRAVLQTLMDEIEEAQEEYEAGEQMDSSDYDPGMGQEYEDPDADDEDENWDLGEAW